MLTGVPVSNHHRTEMRFQDLFRGYTGSHGVSVPSDEVDERGKRKYKHFTKTGAPTEAEWETHLSGSGAGLGSIPLLDDNRNVYWGAIDIDKYQGTIDFSKLEDDISQLPLFITYSKSRGAHLWLFCSEPTSAKLVIECLTQWAAGLGFAGCEVFPKQHTRLVGTNDQGNWINLPYFGNTRCCFHSGRELSLDEFLNYVEKSGRLANESRLRSIQKGVSEGKNSKGELFQDGPPCLQSLAKSGIAPGGRNNALFNIGVYFKSKDPETLAEKYHAFNREFLQLDGKEVTDTLRMIERKEYNYTCSKEPLKGCCDRKVCVKREHGVAKANTATSDSGSTELNIQLSGLTKIDTSSPRWLVNIDGVRAEIPDTKVLMDQKQFGLLVVEKVHKVMTLIKPPQWALVVQGLLDTVEIIEAPIEASPEGQFLAHLINFIERRGQTTTRDNLVSGRVWRCDECKKAYFRPTDLSGFLRREGFRDLDNAQIYNQLHNYGVRKGRWNIKGATVVYYSIPTPNLQNEAFDVPNFTAQEKTNNVSSPRNEYDNAF